MLLNRRQALVASILALLPLPAWGKKKTPPQATVRMYSQHPDDPKQQMVFLPRVVRVPAGATVRFEPASPGHNVVTTPGMLPAGAKPFSGPFSKPFDVAFERPGHYGYHCLAHRSMGMVGLVIVEGEGRDANLKAAKAVQHSGQAQKVWTEIWASLSSSKGASASSGAKAKTKAKTKARSLSQ